MRSTCFCELGRGGIGVVYKTSLQDGRPVAVKKLTDSGLIKSQEEFEREMRKLGKLMHKNIVEIKGYYWTQSLHLLIYEFVSGEAYTDISTGTSAFA
uniref:Protein kinase domain-containing protein n=2 Tax=Brassica TaxID=3705 RepID=A0A0D3CKZ9_BRAOL